MQKYPLYPPFAKAQELVSLYRNFFIFMKDIQLFGREIQEAICSQRKDLDLIASEAYTKDSGVRFWNIISSVLAGNTSCMLNRRVAIADLYREYCDCLLLPAYAGKVRSDKFVELLEMYLYNGQTS